MLVVDFINLHDDPQAFYPRSASTGADCAGSCACMKATHEAGWRGGDGIARNI